MPVQLSYPGVYVEEIPSGVHTITGVPTSIAAFVGRTARGPENAQTTIFSYADFEDQFGGLDVNSPVSYAVRDFFLNGGSQGIIVRLFHPTMSPTQITAVQAAIAAVVNAVNGETDVTKVVATATKAQPAATASQPEKDAAAAIVAAVTTAAAVPAATMTNVQTAAKTAATQNAPPQSTAQLPIGTAVTLQAQSPGTWGQYLRGQIDFDIAAIKTAKWEAAPWKLFTLTIRDTSPGGAVEVYQNLTTEDKPNRIDRVLTSLSSLVEWAGNWPTDPTALATFVAPIQTALTSAYTQYTTVSTEQAAGPSTVTDVQQLGTDRNTLAGLNADPTTALEVAVDVANKNLQAILSDSSSTAGAKTAARGLVSAANTALNGALQTLSAGLTDGGDLTYSDFIPISGPPKQGIYALENADIFNLLCLPTFTTSDTDVLAAAATYCAQRRAVLIVDAPVSTDTTYTWGNANKAVANFTDTSSSAFPIIRSNNAAIYFPRVQYADPLQNMQIGEFPPCGVIAGLYAQTDVSRGVWKAPAGTAAVLNGVQSLAVPLTDAENGLLNPLGVNCLRSFPIAGRVIWGARTLRGADQLSDDYKYVPVRRLALFIEESLYRGTQWAVFEPNDAPLWGQLRLSIGSFMNQLFRQGAFQGSTPQQAYLVKCDGETTTQADINNGVVNVLVAFAPLKPAEFVVLQIQQLAGQIAT